MAAGTAAARQQRGPRHADWRTTWREINALGIGPSGTGGRTTALVHSLRPTHIALLPVAVNISATRRHASSAIGGIHMSTIHLTLP